MGQERLIKSVVAHNLEWDENEETAIDRVSAIGFSDRHNEVGEAMLRVDALDAQALRKVVLLVTRYLVRNYSFTHAFSKRMAIAILHELMRPNCIYCGGKGETFQKGAAVTECSQCSGSGLHRYSDSDRRALIGGAFNKKAYDDALAFVRDAIYRIVRQTNKRLGQ